MKARILNIFKSFVMALAAILSLSCCSVGDEVLIDEIDTETTTETTAGETTEEATEITTEELTTPEITTEETTETTTDETEEATTEETKELTPEETAILETLTDEEKEVWLSMPDIVTMRMLVRLDNNNDEILYTEIIYIDKIGQIKKTICYGEYAPNDSDGTIGWLNEKISQSKDIELINTANIHTLIEFYSAFMNIDSESKFDARYSIGLAVEIERHYQFEIYGVRNGSKSDLEILLISKGNAGHYNIRHNNINDEEPLDESGIKSFDLYLKLDPFIVDIPGGIGHLVGEEG